MARAKFVSSNAVQRWEKSEDAAYGTQKSFSKKSFHSFETEQLATVTPQPYKILPPVLSETEKAFQEKIEVLKRQSVVKKIQQQIDESRKN